MHGYNLMLQTPDRRLHPVGKVVAYQGRLILHEWVSKDMMRRSLNAYGINRSVLLHLQDVGAQMVYLFLPARRGGGTDRCYRATVDALMDAVTTTAPGAGTMHNLPLSEWELTRPIARELPWIPADVRRIVRVVAPVETTPQRKSQPDTDATQSSLWEEAS